MEHVSFQGSVKSAVDGEEVASFDVDFAEAWPRMIRQRRLIGATTTAIDVDMGPVTTAKIVAIKAENPIYITLESATTGHTGPRIQCRGNMVMQANSTHVIVENVVASKNKVLLYVAGI